MTEKPKFNEDYLNDEYFALLNLVDSFDNKGLIIKAWSMTISMAGISIAFVNDSAALLVLASLSAIVFWVLEAYWKAFQKPYIARINAIEAYFSGEVEIIENFQISKGWQKAYAKLNISEPMRRTNIMLPHVIITLIGIVLFILNQLDLPIL